MLSISEIKPYSKNAKKHTEKQIEQIADSIKEFGFNQPIVVDTEHVVIVGHGRLEAAKLIGMTEVPVIIADLPPSKVKAYRLADNKLNESDWDMQLVIEELAHLDDSEIKLTGFDKESLSLFNPASEDEQGKLDKTESHLCPNCGHVY